MTVVKIGITFRPVREEYLLIGIAELRGCHGAVLGHALGRYDGRPERFSMRARPARAKSARKIRRLETSQRPPPTASVRSKRNGVDAEMKVTLSAAINSAARRGSQMFCSITVVCNTTGMNVKPD